MDEILIAAEAAKHLKVSIEHIRHLFRTGVIPAYHEGRKGGWRVKAIEIEKYVDRKLKQEL